MSRDTTLRLIALGVYIGVMFVVARAAIIRQAAEETALVADRVAS